MGQSSGYDTETHAQQKHEQQESQAYTIILVPAIKCFVKENISSDTSSLRRIMGENISYRLDGAFL